MKLQNKFHKHTHTLINVLTLSGRIMAYLELQSADVQRPLTAELIYEAITVKMYVSAFPGLRGPTRILTGWNYIQTKDHSLFKWSWIQEASRDGPANNYMLLLWKYENCRNNSASLSHSLSWHTCRILANVVCCRSSSKTAHSGGSTVRSCSRLDKRGQDDCETRATSCLLTGFFCLFLWGSVSFRTTAIRCNHT